MLQPASLDIVLPCYNPQEGWTQSIVDAYSKICSGLGGAKVSLIIVNDGSPKDIGSEFNHLKDKIPALVVVNYAENKGKGFAVRKGVAMAKADIIIYTDIDFPYREEGLTAIYKTLAAGECDIALGTRDENYYDDVPAARRLISKLLKSVIRLTLNTPTADTQAGLKGFNRKGKEIFMQTTINRYLFDLEFVYLAGRMKDVRTQCVTVKLKDNIRFSKMNWKALFKEAFNFLRIFFRIS